MSERHTSGRMKLRTILSTALFVIMLGLLVWYVWKNRVDMQKLLSLSPQTIFLLLALAVLGASINCVYHLVLLQTYRLKLDLTDWMGVVSVSNAIAYVLPMRADLLFSAAYYKRVKGLAYTKSASMAAGNIIFGVTFSLLQILAALLFMGFLDGQWPGLLWLLWGIGTAGLAGFILLSLFFSDRPNPLFTRFKILENIAKGFSSLLKNRTLLLRLLGCLIANNLVQLILYSVCFHSIGFPVALYEVLFYSGVSWLSGIVAIVPGNIGIRETVMGMSTMLMGMSIQTGVAASLLQRVALLAAHLLMAAVFAIPVTRRMSRERFRESAAITIPLEGREPNDEQ